MFLKPFHRPAEDLFHQPVDDLDAGQVAFMDGAVRRLAGECLLVKRSVMIAVEEAADLVLQLVNALDGGFAKPPSHVLVGKPLAAIDRVHEMALDRVAAAKRHIVAALHHACASALADQPLDRKRDLRACGRALLGVQRGEQSAAAGPEDQDVGVMSVNLCVHPQNALDRLKEENAGQEC